MTPPGHGADCPAELLLAGPGGKAIFCRPDKACMPPSGTAAGTVPDRPAALRLRGPGGGIPQASSVVARLSVAPAGNAPSTTLSHQNHASNIPPTFSESSCWSLVLLTFAVCSLSTWPPVT
ncbi:TPA: hypothetical protein MJE31_18700 [Klebsiella pneumoniae]|nr:hypothetical protein EJB01_00255 [Klebsiella pneumoniae]HBZ0930444.1 hypothetical protein [Klebsiella pneumoniae]HBZ0978260.1 hypothetical protein [Klebsiella pneumoniae]HBZ0984578.1 hypothetical protein [Klebsiella pneumoniae]HBZ1081042.1 hypothetical protein [Klebsiella pneumoniae]